MSRDLLAALTLALEEAEPEPGPGLWIMMREDLDHHLIPDPVGKAIQCLLDRIDTLETQVRDLHGLPAPVKVAGCTACTAGELCCEEHGRG